MQITIYAKKRNTREGKTFYSYLAKLMKKDGTEVTTAVKFRDNGQEMPRPENCPMNIVVEKTNCNFTSKQVQNTETGEIYESNTLWIAGYVPGEPFVDTSMDDFI